MFSYKHLKDKLIRNLGATRLIVLSFVLVILIGTILLSLPFAKNGIHVSFIDNLFTATSATCVTGLMTVVAVDSYSLFGQLVILCLIQIGGLGLMSIVAVMITLFKKKLAYREKTILRDAVNKIDVSDVGKFLIHIIKYTMLFEGIGMFLLSFEMIPTYGVLGGLYHALFLSVSAFCNAGIDLFGSSSLIQYVHNPLVNYTVMFLIITGGLGFTVWIDLRANLTEAIKQRWPFRKFFDHLLLHTKVVLVSSVFLLVSAFIIIYTIEVLNPNTLGGLSLYDQIQAAAFNATTLRTAGFSTINYGLLNRATLLIMCIYMFIGGSPGGTAGGVKTTTVFVIVFYVMKKFRNNDHLTLMKREIQGAQVDKCFVIVLYSFFVAFCGIILLCLSQGHIELMDLIFEAFSAFGTVGLSTGITPMLNTVGKLIIIVLMFTGRVGAIALFVSLVRQSKKRINSVEYPKAEILVG
ncbi:MAG: potassium transporter TrkG [Erysipelotrichaceae bacterium]